jgi:lipopolysaccharide export system ATP-binding protein
MGKERQSVLRVENLVKVYRKRKVVDGVSLYVRQGEIVGLLGPNGAGKTTTFYSIVGLIKPENGKIYIDDEEITRLPMHKRARLGIAYLPQEPSIFRKLTVEENIKAILEFLNLSKEEINRKVEELLEELSITHIRNQKGYTLSGGERRRTEFARALTTNPKFILLDEPFAGIDPIAVADIQSIIRSLKKNNIGIIITDHNVRETLSITDRAYIMYSGKILVSGSSEKLIKDKKAREIYLGENFRI